MSSQKCTQLPAKRNGGDKRVLEYISMVDKCINEVPKNLDKLSLNWEKKYLCGQTMIADFANKTRHRLKQPPAQRQHSVRAHKKQMALLTEKKLQMLREVRNFFFE